MSRYVVSDKAATDLTKIWDGYVERGGSSANANHLIDELLDSFQNLADFPDIGTPRDYLPDAALALPHKDYIIHYEKRDFGVEIVQVLYGRMYLEGGDSLH